MRRIAALLAGVLFATPLFAGSLGTAPRTVIPSEVQQIISIDYRTINNNPTARALKERVLPEHLKQLETAIRAVGIDPGRDVEQLTFASFRTKEGLRIIGIAQGQFSTKRVATRAAKQKIKATRFRGAAIYPMTGGLSMTLLDDLTLMFGESNALRTALRTRAGELPSVNGNAQITEMVGSVEDGAIWSVLDQKGTQVMLRSALGDASQLGSFDNVQKRLLGSRYTLDFGSGVDFKLNVHTSDTMTAATLSSLLKASMLYRGMNATPAEKMALESMRVNSETNLLSVSFRSDEKKFQSIIQSEMFKAVSQ